MIKLFNKQVEIIFAEKTNSVSTCRWRVADEEVQQCVAQPTFDLWGAKLRMIQKKYNVRNLVRKLSSFLADKLLKN